MSWISEEEVAAYERGKAANVDLLHEALAEVARLKRAEASAVVMAAEDRRKCDQLRERNRALRESLQHLFTCEHCQRDGLCQGYEDARELLAQEGENDR